MTQITRKYRADVQPGSPEYAIMQALLDIRSRLRITQAELSRRTGIDQGDISKLERCTRNPSLRMLKRLADGLGMDLQVNFIPREEGDEN